MRHYAITTQLVRRSPRRGIVRLAAEQAADCLHDDLRRTDFDFRDRICDRTSLILASADTPSWATQRQALWNTVQNAAVRMNVLHVAMLITLEVPFTIRPEAQTQAATTFVTDHLIRRGLIVDMTIERVGFTSIARLLVTTARVQSEGGFHEMAAAVGPRRFMRCERDWSRICARALLSDMATRRKTYSLAPSVA